MLADAGAAGLPLAALTSRAGVDPGNVHARADALVAAGEAVRAADVLVAARNYEQLKGGIVAALGQHHRAQPLSEGMPREELRDQLFKRGNAMSGAPIMSGTNQFAKPANAGMIMPKIITSA